MGEQLANLGYKEVGLGFGDYGKKLQQRKGGLGNGKKKTQKMKEGNLVFSFKWEDIASCVGNFEGEGKDNNSKRKKGSQGQPWMEGVGWGIWQIPSGCKYTQRSQHDCL